MSIQPINNEVGVINYIRYLYGNTKGNAVAGNEFASGILYQGSDPYYSSEEIHGEGVVVTAGAGGTITGTLAWKPILKGSIQLSVTFQQGSTTQRGIIVDRRDVASTGNTGSLIVLDALTHEVVNDILDSAKSSVNYSSGVFTATFKSTVTLVDDSSTLLDYRYDNRSIGNGAVGANQLRVPEVNIRIDSMPVVCQSRKLKALYAFDAA